ncbi:MAG: hypothetical protein ACYS8S_05070, partial [Planctomycetota bacterium]
MKSKNTIGILVAAGLIAVLVILIIIFNTSNKLTVEPEAVTPEAPASEVTTPPVDAQPPLDPKDVIAPIVKKVLEETDALYERTLIAYKTKINEEPPYWGKYIAGYVDAKEGRYPEAIERLQRR